MYSILYIFLTLEWEGLGVSLSLGSACLSIAGNTGLSAAALGGFVAAVKMPECWL